MLGLLFLIAGCATARKSTTGISVTDDAQPISALVEATNQPQPIGKFLADIDSSVHRWTNLMLTAQSDEDRRKAKLLENHLMKETHARRGELIEQLESGPLNNRVVAASALGFTREVEAQSPLLAALDDEHSEVVSNALLGLWLLGRADTPLDKICALLRSSSEDWVRSNAALCAMNLVKIGARNDCIRDAARIGLSDREPGVRAQCAWILATLVDGESMPALADLLGDPIPLVSAAAARAVASIGTQSPHDKGAAARALAKAYETAKRPAREHAFRGLVELAGVSYGTDTKEWSEWAQRLP